MEEKRTLDDLVKRLGELLPSGIGEMRSDLEKNFKSVLHSAFQRMDLVTREEFDVQRAVLAKTREKVEALEAQLDQLEKG